MRPTTSHAVQPFVRTKKGRVDRGPIRPCHSAESARRLAERLVATGCAIGALAFSLHGDLDGGDFEEPEILCCVGSVPAEDGDLPF